MGANIIVDSCSYFRLAQSIHPLLKTPFCEEPYLLGVIKELHDEYKKSAALKSKFFWVDHKEYAENRKRCFTLSVNQKTDISNSFYFIRDTAREEGYGVSRVDLIALSHAYVLNIPVVTDDGDMIALAKEYDINALKSLDLLKLLYDCEIIDLDKIRSIAGYWVYQRDTPKSYKKDFRKLFKEKAP